MTDEQNENGLNANAQGNESSEISVQELMNRHMADPNHVITDEDLAKVKVGMPAAPDEPTKQAIKDAEDRIADRKADNDDDAIPGAQKMTPWDTINP